MTPSPPPAAEKRTAELVWICHRKADVERATRAFLEPRGAQLRLFDTPEELLAALEQGRPRLLVVDLFISGVVLNSIGARLKKPDCEAVSSVVVALKEHRPAYVSKAAALPRSTLVSGTERFVARLIEALAESTGIPYRRYFRDGLALKAQLRPSPPSPEVPEMVEGTIEDLSDSGLKVSLSLAPSLDSQWTVRFQLPESRGEVTARAAVVRYFRDDRHGRFFVGMRFEELDEESALKIRDATAVGKAAPPPPQLPIEDPQMVRSTPRIAVPSRLALKGRLTPRGGDKRLYVDIEDVSANGFRAVARFESGFEPGQQFEILLLWAGESFTATCTLARAAIEVAGARTRRVLGFQFITLPPKSRSQLSKLLAEARSRGVKVARAKPQRKTSGPSRRRAR